MAKSLDVAIKILEESIERGKSNPEYYMDFIKLHKLMYLGYCSLSYLYGLELFEESITANADGPYIEGLNSIPAMCGFGKITNIDELEKLKKLKFVLPLSFSRAEICGVILDCYGTQDTMELVRFSKETTAYQISFNEKQKNIIHKKLLTTTGEEISKDIIDKQNKNGNVLTKKLTPSKYIH